MLRALTALALGLLATVDRCGHHPHLNPFGRHAKLESFLGWRGQLGVRHCFRAIRLRTMSASVSLRKRRSVASRPITNRPQTITGQQNKTLNEEQERERQAKELDARRRRARRRLDELERINYRDAPTAPSSSTSAPATASTTLDPVASASTEHVGETDAGVSAAQRRRNHAEIKRILVSGRRNLHSIVDDLVDQGKLPSRPAKGGANWRSARSGPPQRPGRKYCSICGFHGDLACIRCAQRYCSRKCRDVYVSTFPSAPTSSRLRLNVTGC